MKGFKARYPQIPTKSGLMVGLGETDDEILEVLRDLRANDVEMLDWAGLSVAVAGGAAEAHGADHVIPVPQDGGWAGLLDLLETA